MITVILGYILLKYHAFVVYLTWYNNKCTVLMLEQCHSPTSLIVVQMQTAFTKRRLKLSDHWTPIGQFVIKCERLRMGATVLLRQHVGEIERLCTCLFYSVFVQLFSNFEDQNIKNGTSDGIRCRQCIFWLFRSRKKPTRNLSNIWNISKFSNFRKHSKHSKRSNCSSILKK